MLQQEYAHSKHAALEAEQDAAEARNNARHAQEVARRYKHRTYTPTPLKASNPNHPRSQSSQPSPVPLSTKMPSLTSASVRATPPPRPPSSGNAVHSSPLYNTSSSSAAQASRSSSSHAEDVLSLSLEVSELQAQLRQEREVHQTEVAELTLKLEQALKEGAMAEEDAAMGLELAKQAHEQRDYLSEQVLPPLQEELEYYKQQLQQHLNMNTTTMEQAPFVAVTANGDYLEDDDDGSLTTYDNNTTDTVGALDDGDNENGEVDTLDGDTTATLDSRKVNAIVNAQSMQKLGVGVDSAPPSPNSPKSKEAQQQPQPPRASKAMVAVGRNLFVQKQQELKQKQIQKDGQKQGTDGTHLPHKSAQYYTIHLQQLSAKRQALWERLKVHDQRQQRHLGTGVAGAGANYFEGAATTTPQKGQGPSMNMNTGGQAMTMSPLTPYNSNANAFSPPPSSNNSVSITSRSHYTGGAPGAGSGMYLTSASCDSLLKLLRQSSLKMELNLRQDNTHGVGVSPPGSAASPSPAQIEQVAAEFCHAVEDKVKSLMTECQQLEALCVYLESKHVPSSSTSTSTTNGTSNSNSNSTTAGGVATAEASVTIT
jgi:hypothetical protein